MGFLVRKAVGEEREGRSGIWPIGLWRGVGTMRVGPSRSHAVDNSNSIRGRYPQMSNWMTKIPGAKR